MPLQPFAFGLRAFDGAFPLHTFFPIWHRELRLPARPAQGVRTVRIAVPTGKSAVHLRRCYLSMGTTYGIEWSGDSAKK